jgi:hypothetical protein
MADDAELYGAAPAGGLSAGLGAGLGEGLGLGSPADIESEYADAFNVQRSQSDLLDQATEALKRQRAPSIFGALGAGLSQPKTQPGIAGTLANLNAGLQAYDQQKAAFDRAQADKLLEYKLKALELQARAGDLKAKRTLALATLAARQEAAKAAQQKAPRPVTPEDEARYPGVSAKTHMMVGEKPELIPVPKSDARTPEQIKAALLERLLSGEKLTPQEQQALTYLNSVPAGYTPAPGGGVVVDPNYVAGQGKIAAARRAPPKAAPRADNPASKYQ